MKTVLTLIGLVALGACSATTQTLSVDEVEPHMIAGSEARKEYCESIIHNRGEYRDCVDGLGLIHRKHSEGVAYPDRNKEGDK